MPTVFEAWGVDGAAVEGDLTSINAMMARIDLVAEITGPVLAGFALSVLAGCPIAGFALVGGLNALTFVPQYLLLRWLHEQCPRLQSPRKAPEAGAGGGAGSGVGAHPTVDAEVVAKESGKDVVVEPGGPCCPGLGLGVWAVWACHPGGVPLVSMSMSYALLYFTALSPHGIPLTAYLASHGGVRPLQLELFRGAGAFAGIFVSTLHAIPVPPPSPNSPLSFAGPSKRLSGAGDLTFAGRACCTSFFKLLRCLPLPLHSTAPTSSWY